MSKLTASIGLAIFFLTVSLTRAQTPVVVTNRNNDSVPVKVVNDPAKRAYHAGVDLAFPSTGEYPAVPAGQTFVVQYITGKFRTYNAFGAAACKPYDLSVGARPDADSPIESYSIVPTYMGTGQGISGEVNFYAVNQSVTIYIAAGFPIAPAFSLGPVCTAPTIQGRIVLSGYLVKTN